MRYEPEDRTPDQAAPHQSTQPPTDERDADRRAGRRLAAIAAAVVAVTALGTAGVAQTAGATAGGQAPSGSMVLSVPATTATESPSPDAAAVPDRPTLKITVAYERTGRDVALTLGFNGHVLRPFSTETGEPVQLATPAGREIGLGEKLAWGDGTNADVAAAPQRCPEGDEQRTLHPVQDEYTVPKTYAAAGEYTIDYTYFACGLTDGKINGKLTLQIP